MNSDQLAAAVRRAAQRVPGPVAERSLAAVRSLPIPDVRIPDPDPNDRPLRIAPGEQWCARCYEPTNEWNGRLGDHKAACPRCGHRKFVSAAAVLRPEEYYIAT